MNRTGAAMDRTDKSLLENVDARIRPVLVCNKLQLERIVLRRKLLNGTLQKPRQFLNLQQTALHAKYPVAAH